MMKLAKSLCVTTLFWLFTQAYPVLATTEEADDLEQICPDSNPLNCYPKLFVPTEEWQTVREGQVIPVGLQVRLDLENMSREAKLSGETNSDHVENSKNHDLVITNSNSDFQSALGVVYNFAEMRLSKTSPIILLDALEVVDEWSSDIEYGVAIANEIQPLLKLSGLYESDDFPNHPTFGLSNNDYSKVQDLVYRILASCFRNNVEAQTIFLKFLPDPDDLLNRLVAFETHDSKLILRRKLGMLGSLLNNGVFHTHFLRAGIQSKLILLYTKIDDTPAKKRILNILDDLESSKLEKRDNTLGQKDAESVNTGDDDGPLQMDSRYAIVAQNELIESSSSNHDNNAAVSADILEGLAEIKRNNKGAFKPSNEFLDWMDKKINTQKNHLKLQKRGEAEYGATEKHLEHLIELRHEVFGNPLGSRKDYFDEL